MPAKAQSNFMIIVILLQHIMLCYVMLGILLYTKASSCVLSSPCFAYTPIHVFVCLFFFLKFPFRYPLEYHSMNWIRHCNHSLNGMAVVSPYENSVPFKLLNFVGFFVFDVRFNWQLTQDCSQFWVMSLNICIIICNLSTYTLSA